MKFHLTITILLISAKLAIANDIDSLKTAIDVQKFLVEKVNKEWKDVKFFLPNSADTSAYGKNKFFKVDLDGNGLTDLVLNGSYLIAVTDIGKGKFEGHILDRGAFALDKHTLKNIVYDEGIPLLIISDYQPSRSLDWPATKPDTLIFTLGGFMEYNPTNEKVKIKEIIYSTSGCYGNCPIFELSIKANKSASYNAKEHNSKKGMFKGKIDRVAFERLLATISYAQILSLEDEYSVNWTDDQTVTLEIELTNGRKKRIKDYGAIGTFGLQNIYSQLLFMRTTQNWK